MFTLVTLHGALAQVVGRAQWKLAVKSPGEAVRAIECQTGKLFAHLVEKDADGVTYRVIADGEDIAGQPELLSQPVKHFRTIDLVPIPAGAAGLFETIAGAALIVVGIVLTLIPYTAWLGPSVIMAGVGLLASGVAQLFFGPKPPVVAHQSKDTGNDKDTTASYLFNGPVNTVGQGGPVPILYGRMIIGGQVISSGIRTSSTRLEGDEQTEDDDHAAKTAAVLAATGGLAGKVNKDDGDRIKKGLEQDDDDDD